MKFHSILFASVFLSLTSVGAWASPDHEPPKTNSGSITLPISDDLRNGFDRTITVESGTRWVNVRRYEMIRFVVKPASGTSSEFIRRMDLLSNKPYPLSKLAPEELAPSLAGVMVYVAPDRVSRR